MGRPRDIARELPRCIRPAGLLVLLALVLLVLLTGCGDDSSVEPLPDAGSQPRVDAGSARCSADIECSDARFCNGVELCKPGDADADARGCVAASEVPCRQDQACVEEARRCDTLCSVTRDADGDGVDAEICGGKDCDDADPRRFPGNAEVCDEQGLDEDCDPTTFGTRDLDGDGFVDAACCNAVTGSTPLCGLDCDDTRENIRPDANEACDNLDNDCNGKIDEGVAQRGFFDGDLDQHGDPHKPVSDCGLGRRFSIVGDDCNDGSARVHGAQQEFCDEVDNDCDGAIDEDARPVTWYLDADGDGFGDGAAETTESCEPLTGHSILGSDCDDADGSANPGADEICDGVDNDCDGMIDEDAALEGFVDEDGDGFGQADAMLLGCPGDPGFATRSGDCDDTRTLVYPGSFERCDDIDNDCDEIIDEGVRLEGFVDADFDLHGDPDAPTTACVSALGFSVLGDDCDDGDPRVHPSHPEICDNVDNDCDEMIDDETRAVSWYLDADGDGFGDPLADTVVDCSPVPNHVLLPLDCDDSDAQVNPGAPELCDGRDNNCNGLADYAIAGDDFEDDDGDGQPDMACATGTLLARDCDDRDATSFSGASELCDGRDNDCDGKSDEDTGQQRWYPDADRDSYGDRGAAGVLSCKPVVGHVPRALDCDDSSARVRPGVLDGCDGVDNDCDAMVDEGSLRLAYYPDLDGDGAGGGMPILSCAALPGHTLSGADCNDSDASVRPGASELCDGIDNDCDGKSDEGVRVSGYADTDGDLHGDPDAPMSACIGARGFSRLADDCDDSRPEVHAAQVEICDGIDNDCDLQADEETMSVTWYADLDADGFGSPSSGTRVDCTPLSGWVLLPSDCDDDDDQISPTRIEACDAIDNDCDGRTDEGLIGGGSELCEGYNDEDCDGVIDEGCDCLVGTSRVCGSSAQGACRRGIQVCASDGQWGSCIGSVEPSAELCDGSDNDCNGLIDDGLMASCEVTP